jgi:hypothetical protein
MAQFNDLKVQHHPKPNYETFLHASHKIFSMPLHLDFGIATITVNGLIQTATKA